MQHKEGHDPYHTRKYLSLLHRISRCNTCPQPMFATMESEVLNCLIRTLSDDEYQSCKYCEYGLYIIDRGVLGTFFLRSLSVLLLAPVQQGLSQLQSVHFPLCSMPEKV